MRRVLLLTPVIFAFGCDMATEGRVEDLSRRITRLEARQVERDEKMATILKKVEELSAEVEDLSEGVVEFRFKSFMEERQEKAEWRGLEDSSFRKVRTHMGDILVSIEDVQPYATGTRLKMTFGNPSFATLQDVTAKIRYGAKFDFDRKSKADFASARKAWEATMLTHETELKQLVPGSWNEQTVTLPGRKPDQVSYLEVTFEIRSISLRRD